MTKATAVPGPTASRIVPFLGVAGGVAFVLWFWAAMMTQVCTSDAFCTLERCPARCDRPEQILIGALVIIAATTAVGLARAALARPMFAVQGVLVVVAAMLLAVR